ncbi:hypothetical protein PROVRETT_07667 [Providencia rettgeri DSM 1131]|nr:hypothetical protein PROVRETT_07667 [Providencia rettgeri DSM 1131]
MLWLLRENRLVQVVGGWLHSFALVTYFCMLLGFHSFTAYR